MAAILIVEDDPDVAALIRLRMTKSGHDVAVATDGVQGLAAAQHATPDIVILDWMMPHMNGIEVCERLRSSALFSATKIMMLTARATQSDRERALSAGADDYVTKPFSPRALVERVEALIA